MGRQRCIFGLIFFLLLTVFGFAADRHGNATGIKVDGVAGVFKIYGLGGGFDENFTFDLNSISNSVTFGSDTGVTDLIWGGLNFSDVGTIDSGRITLTDGGLLSTGTTDGFTIPSGSGTRMMWIPSKRAFRAGRITGSQWDGANIGNYSIAFGFDNTASGNVSSCFGNSGIASGAYSAHFGTGGTASGTDSAHFGAGGTASGTESTHFGIAGTASGDYSFHTGWENLADAFGVIAFGRYSAPTGGNLTSWVSTDPIFVIGNGTGTGARSTVFTILKNGNLETDGIINSGVITQSGTTLDNTYHPLTTVGIANNNLVKVNAVDVADNEYAKFTDAGLESKTFAEVLADLSGQATGAFAWNNQDLTGVGNITGSDIDINAGTGRFVTTGTVACGVISVDSHLALFDLGTFQSTFLRIKASDNAYSANRILDIDLGNENRTLIFTGGIQASNITLGDWFDQNVKISAFPLFEGIGTGGDTDLLSFEPDALTVNGTIASGAVTLDANADLNLSGTGQIFIADGTFDDLAIAFASQTNIGMFKAGAGFGFVTAGVMSANFTNTGMAARGFGVSGRTNPLARGFHLGGAGNDGVISFGGTASIGDVAITRSAAGILAIGTDHTVGKADGAIILNTVTLLATGNTNRGSITHDGTDINIDPTVAGAGGVKVSGRIFTPKQSITLGVGVTTFAITSNFVVLTGDGGTNTIATITGGKDGMVLRILFVDGLVTITDTNDGGADTIDLSAAFTGADDTVLTLLYDGTLWREISRSVN